MNLRRASLLLMVFGLFSSIGLMSQCPPSSNQLFLNPSFEEMNCCPTEGGMISCIDNWFDPRVGESSDYYHVCDYMGQTGFEPPDHMADGEGCTGVLFGSNGGELLMTCTANPVSTTESYTFSAYVGFNFDNNFQPMNPLTLALYGSTGSCGNAIFNSPCPPAVDWDYITDLTVEFPVSQGNGWIKGVSACFIPVRAYDQFIIGSDCMTGTGYNYIDLVELRPCYDTLHVNVEIESSCGNTNDGSIDLTITGGAPPYTFDWDIDGTGDNDDPEDLIDLPPGPYQVTVTDFDGLTRCLTLYVPEIEAIETMFDPIGPFCQGDPDFVLPTTSQNDPPISGSWQVSSVSTTTPGQFDYVFTPDIQFCATTYTANVTIIRTSTEEDTIRYMGCENDGYEIRLNGRIYNESNPIGTEVLNLPTVCDSVVQVVMDFREHSTGLFSKSNCQGSGYSILINGNLYDENRPYGIETLVNQFGCDSIVTIDLEYFQIPIHDEVYLGCNGDGHQVVINSTVYNESNPIGTEILTSANGCDSIVRVSMIFHDVDRDTFSRIGCKGDGFSIEIDQVVYDEQNPSGTATLLSEHGCDSFVVVDLDFSDQAVLPIEHQRCIGDGFELVINGTTYNEQNPSGIELIRGTQGCDTLAQIDLFFADTSSGHFVEQPCKGSGYQIEVNGTIYNESHPVGKEIVPTQYGCDSIIYIELTFSDEIHEQATYAGCADDGYEVVVNGTIYDESNPTGIERLVSTNGCDSIVTVDLQFFQVSNDLFNTTACQGDGYEIIINGTLYNESNPSGEEYLVNQRGCDSVVQVFIEYLAIPESFELYSGCQNDGYEVLINGTIYDENNPAGTEILKASSGCDSIVYIELNYFEESSSLQSYHSCEGDDFMVEINGTIYNASNPTGIERLTGYRGCDSVVSVVVDVVPPQEDTLTHNGCVGDSYEIVVAGTIYNEANPNGVEYFTGMYGCDSIVYVDFNFGPVYRKTFVKALCDDDNYSITFGNTTFNAANPVGEVFISGDESCDTVISVDLTFHPTHEFSRTFSGAGSQEVRLDIAPNLVSLPSVSQIQWTPANMLDCDTCVAPIYSGLENEEFQVEVWDDLGCRHTGMVSVIIEEEAQIFIPDIFTPNNDGINDVFQPLTAPGRVYFVESFEIFNRWGGRVFQRHSLAANDVRLSWDGTRAGAVVSEGVYAYVLRVKSATGFTESYYGNVTLIR